MDKEEKTSESCVVIPCPEEVVEPGGRSVVVFSIGEVPLMVEAGQVFVPTDLEVQGGRLSGFEVVFVACGTDVLLGEYEVRWSDDRARLKIVDPPSAKHVVALFTNTSPSQRKLRAQLVGYATEALEEEEVVVAEGLLDRCQRWFSEGLLAALESRGVAVPTASSNPTIEETERVLRNYALYLEKGPTLLATLRKLFAAVADVAAIPLEASRAYWDDLSGVGRGEGTEPETRLTTISVGPQPVEPESLAVIKISSRLAFRPKSLRLSSVNGTYFTITDVRVDGHSQFPSPSHIHGAMFCGPEGLPLGLDSGHDVEICVTNRDGASHVFWGVLVGEVVS